MEWKAVEEDGGNGRVWRTVEVGIGVAEGSGKWWGSGGWWKKWRVVEVENSGSGE